MDIRFSCQCGALRGTVAEVSPANGTRAVCYCTDCQAFAAVLGQIDYLLDERGGTTIYQTLPANVTIERGAEQLAALTLTKRPLLRWYARCCNTPLGNTMNSRDLPFVGITGLDRAAEDPAAADRAMGPSKGAVFADRAWQPGGIRKAFMPGLMFAFARRVLGAKLKKRTGDTPFFDAENRPVGAVRKVTREERAEADRALAEHAARAG